jgi:hypothetical protein
MPDHVLQQAGSAEVLTGRLAEYQELLEVLTERPGLAVISADPLSGTSALLSAVADQLDGDSVVIDARACADGLDLAMAVADAAVAELAPDAKAWWMETAPPAGAAGLRLARTLSQQGIDLDDLRLGTGPGERRLSESIELLLALADGGATLVIDHFGLMLSALARQEARQLLGELRATRQTHALLDLVLVEHSDGPISAALADQSHPLYRSGVVLDIHRAAPRRFIDDLAITRPWTEARTELIGAAAELAAGVPALTWRIVDLAPSRGYDDHTQALAGWRRLQQITATATARQWDLLRRVHPLAQSVVAAMSVGLRPHAVSANPKSINDALGRLRELGMAWQPERRRWELADPLLSGWARDHAPPWTARRRSSLPAPQ